MINLRGASGPVGRMVSGLNWLNQRHPWSHNDYYHRWVLRHLPADRRSALDVGCGRGELAARLAPVFAEVCALDADAEMAAASRSRLGGHANVRVQQAAFEETGGQFDLITMFAVLHHMDLGRALRHAAECLNPGGRLLVVGLARLATNHDLAYDLTSAVLNPLVGIAKHPIPVRGPAAAPPFPVMDATLSFDQIKTTADAVLPGVQMRRQLFFRYTLVWTKPST